MLRGHSTFKQLKEQYDNRIEYHKKGNEKYISPEDLTRVKGEIKVWAQKQRRKQNLVIAVSILALLGALSFFYLVNQEVRYQTEEGRALKEQGYQSQLTKKVVFYMDDAQFMMTQEKYHNANFQYNKAIELAPSNTNANVGKVYSLIMLCTSEEKHCDEIERAFGDSYSQVNDKDMYLDELFKLSLSTDDKSKILLQEMVNSVQAVD